ncbi:MAG: hypothetical protein GY816_16165, partial [Cytophagales bacterium]|nr:hypothetical protein [Cytophagales bacterium]
FSLTLTAQDSLSVESTDSLSYNMVTPAIYLDYGKLLTAPSNFETKYEGALELIFKDKWQVIGEIGYSDLTPRSALENGNYHSKGTYVRYGLGWLPHREANSRIGIGVRYAMSSFKDQGSYTILSPSELQPDIEVPIDRRNLSATWWETVLYSDMDMNNWLSIGFQIRVRIMQKYDSFEDVDVVTIPGYGRAQDKRVPAVNLFLKFSPF